MKNIFNYILVFIFLFIISGCDVLDNHDGKTSKNHPLDSKINFKIYESYETYGAIAAPEVYIHLITEKIYGCMNFAISNNYKVEEKKIIVDILGIRKGNICATALGPATARLHLGKLSGVYEIVIRGNGFVDNYNLLISDSLIIVDGKETENTKPLVDFLYRYPPNSFVYLCGTTLTETSICTNFIDTLTSVIDLTEFKFSDFAKIPYRTKSGGYHNNSDARFFYYKNEEDFDKIEDVMRSFKQNHFPNKDGIGLSIINWMNKKHLSWML